MCNYIGFVPLRGGSKSIPLKNIKPINAHPLCFYSLYALQNSVCSKVIVATDSQQIANVVNSFNFSKVSVYHRNPQNATDTASSESVILEYLQSATNLHNPQDYLVFAQATSIFTTSAHINNAIKFLHNNNYSSVLSATLSKRFFWNKKGCAINYNFLQRPRRQDFDGFYQENGAFYINKISNILQNKNRLTAPIGVFEMPEYTALEIDEEIDWTIAEILIQKYNPILTN